MSIPIRVLMLEDNASDAELVLHALRRSGYDPTAERVETEQDYREQLQRSPDIILSDFSMPNFDALRALEILRESQLNIPIIVISGSIGEERAVEVMLRGATDYLIKDRLGRLGQAVGYALEQERLRNQTRIAERRLKAQHEVTQALANSPSLAAAGSAIVQAVCQTMAWDFGALWHLDDSREFMRCVDCWSHPSVQHGQFHEVTRRTVYSLNDHLVGGIWASGQPTWLADVGSVPHFSRARCATSAGLHGVAGFPIVLEAETLGVLEFLSSEIKAPSDETLKMMAAIGSQIGQYVERKRAEASLRQSNQTLKAANLAKEEQLEELEHLYRLAPVGLALLDRNCRVLRTNDRLATIFGKPVHEQVGRTLREISPDLAPEIESVVHWVLTSGESVEDQEIRRSESTDAAGVRDWLGTYYPIRSSDGIPTYV